MKMLHPASLFRPQFRCCNTSARALTGSPQQSKPAVTVESSKSEGPLNSKRQYMREYIRTHKDSFYQSLKKYRAKNKEAISDYHKTYRYLNKTQIAERKLSNKEMYKANAKKRILETFADAIKLVCSLGCDLLTWTRKN